MRNYFSKKSKTKRTGLTFVEVVISSSLISMVIAFVGYLFTLQATHADYYFKMQRAESKARNLAELIRYNVVMAKFGTVVITDNGRTLTFNDPNLNDPVKGNNVSRLVFDGQNLRYTTSYTGNNQVTLVREYKGLKNVNFSTANLGGTVIANIETEADLYRKVKIEYDRAEQRKYKTSVNQRINVYLRN